MTTQAVSKRVSRRVVVTLFTLLPGLCFWGWLLAAENLNTAPAPESCVQAGAMLADQAMAVLGSGGEITVISRDQKQFPHPATALLEDAFKRALQKAGAKVSSWQTIPIDPLRPLSLPAGDFIRVLRSCSQKDVLVSLAGTPVASELQNPADSSPKPAVIAFCPGQSWRRANLPELFAQGVLKAAIIGPVPKADGSPLEYTLVTAANLDRLSILERGVH